MKVAVALAGQPTAAPSVAVEGPHGPVRLKWHKLRTRLDEAPFKLSNLALGWGLGASIEVDILASAGGRFLVLHDATLGPSTTGRGRLADLKEADTEGVLHRDGKGRPDPDAPVLSLAALMTRLRNLPHMPGANLQLDLKVTDHCRVTAKSVADAAEAAAGLGHSLIIGSHYLEEARRLADAIPGAKLGYDPMLAASRDRGLARKPERLLRHIERRSKGVRLAYLRYDVVIAAERSGFPLVRRLLDIGIETDAWTVNPGSGISRADLCLLIGSSVRQITTDSSTLLARAIAAALGTAVDSRKALGKKGLRPEYEVGLRSNTLGSRNGGRLRGARRIR
jgi:glycerophosphoryl diester phosphodiesterase